MGAGLMKHGEVCQSLPFLVMASNYHQFSSLQSTIQIHLFVQQDTEQWNEQVMFWKVLNGIRLYQSSPEDISWLQKFQWEDLRKTYGDELLNGMGTDGLDIFPSKREQWNHNSSKLQEMNHVFLI